jgi:hypothetical protein
VSDEARTRLTPGYDSGSGSDLTISGYSALYVDMVPTGPIFDHAAIRRSERPSRSRRNHRTLGREFGATDVVSDRGEEGITAVREPTGGHGTHVVLEAVGHMSADEQARGVVRPGGVISRVGVPQYDDARSASTACSAPTSGSPEGPARLLALKNARRGDVEFLSTRP